MLNYFPKYFTSKAITFYMAALIVSNLIFFNRILSPLWWVFGIVEVVAFFTYSNQLTRKWAELDEKQYEKKLFRTSLIIRLVWVVVAYEFYMIMTGTPFEFDAADARGYHGEASWVADMIAQGNLQPYFKYIGGRFSDMGYPFYLGIEYFFTGKSILIERILKAFYGAFTAVLVYRLTVRTFGQEAGKIAGIFAMLMPNLILYCGLHTKEVEMVLLTVWFMERADFLIRSKSFTFFHVLPTMLLAISLFFFRTVLGATALFALFTAVMFSSKRMMSMGRRVMLMSWVLLAGVYYLGSSLANEAEAAWNQRNESQETSYNARTTEKNGNKFIKYVSAPLIAPMIFVIPFPTVVDTPKQENQKIINGGNYVKNILAFFVLLAIYTVIREKRWRDYLLIGTFTVGYLAVLAASAFAQAERFHQPVLPFELIMAAYGLSVITNKEKKWYQWWLYLIFAIIVAWSWFKLAGRGLA